MLLGQTVHRPTGGQVTISSEEVPGLEAEDVQIEKLPNVSDQKTYGFNSRTERQRTSLTVE